MPDQAVVLDQVRRFWEYAGADRLVGRVRRHRWDVAHQLADTTKPVEVEHHPVEPSWVSARTLEISG
jgi:hypothetical protein